MRVRCVARISKFIFSSPLPFHSEKFAVYHIYIVQHFFLSRIRHLQIATFDSCESIFFFFMACAVPDSRSDWFDGWMSDCERESFRLPFILKASIFKCIQSYPSYMCVSCTRANLRIRHIIEHVRSVRRTVRVNPHTFPIYLPFYSFYIFGFHLFFFCASTLIVFVQWGRAIGSA